VRKADNLPPYCAVVTKSGNLNLLKPCGPVQACNETALPFYLRSISQLASKSSSLLPAVCAYKRIMLARPVRLFMLLQALFLCIMD